MSTTEIILAILSSSVISAVLTSYFNWRIHNSNYKKDYYKKILDKRLDAYETLNSFTSRLSDVVYVEKGVVHGLLCSSESFNFIITKFHLTMEKSYWFAEETGHKLTELGVFLFNEVSGYVDDSLPEDELDRKYLELGIKHFDKINEIKESLKKSANQEMKKLYEINSFFENNGKDSKSYPVYEKAIDK